MSMAKDQTIDSAAAAIVHELENQAERLYTPCGDGDMVWRRWGNGPRHVILFHGAHGSWSHWIRNIPVLAERYTVLAPDLPGMGDSAKPPEPATGESLAAILADGLVHVLGDNTPTAHIAGFSFGASLACLLAERLPERLASLSLICGGGLRMSPVGRANTKGWRRLTDIGEIKEVHRHNLAAMMIANPDAVDDLAVFLQHNNTRSARLDNRPIANEGVTLRSLPQVRIPVGAIWGECDLGDAERRATLESILHGAQPDLTLQVIPGAGHWVQYEAADRFNPMLMALLHKYEDARRP